MSGCVLKAYLSVIYYLGVYLCLLMWIYWCRRVSREEWPNNNELSAFCVSAVRLSAVCACNMHSGHNNKTRRNNTCQPATPAWRSVSKYACKLSTEIILCTPVSTTTLCLCHLICLRGVQSIPARSTACMLRIFHVCLKSICTFKVQTL